MCVNPIRIHNPLFNSLRGDTYLTKKDGQVVVNPLTREVLLTKDFQSEYIFVDCRKCYECLGKRQSNYIIRSYIESLKSYPFMLTLTYNDESLSYYDLPDGSRFSYPNYKDFQSMIKHIRNDGLLKERNMSYMVSSEFSKRGRPHFHALIFFEKLPGDGEYEALQLEHYYRPIFLQYWSRNVGTRKFPKYKPLCTFHSRYSYGRLRQNYDFHLVLDNPMTPVSTVPHYLTKYLFKPSDYETKLKGYIYKTFGLDTLKSIPRYIFSRVQYSSGFGDDFDVLDHYCHECISNNVTPSIYVDGKAYPIPRYLVSKYISLDDDLSRKAQFCNEHGFVTPVKDYNANKHSQDKTRLSDVRKKLKDFSAQFVDLSEF